MKKLIMMNPLLTKLCSKCKKNEMECECNTFHPNFKIPIITGIQDPDLFSLNRDEARELQRFLFSVGYISHEHHSAIHDISKRLDEFLK